MQRKKEADWYRFAEAQREVWALYNQITRGEKKHIVGCTEFCLSSPVLKTLLNKTVYLAILSSTQNPRDGHSLEMTPASPRWRERRSALTRAASETSRLEPRAFHHCSGDDSTHFFFCLMLRRSGHKKTHS